MLNKSTEQVYAVYALIPLSGLSFPTGSVYVTTFDLSHDEPSWAVRKISQGI